MIEQIITDILKAEGWDTYTNDPDDRGGPTKWGITLKAWRSYHNQPALNADNVKAITEGEARLFYHKKYIVLPGYTRIADPFLMAMVVDAAVNHGPVQATKWLQKAVGVAQDGILGSVTAKAVNSQSPVITACSFIADRVRFYGMLVSRDHSQAKFARGWNNRAAKWLDRLVENYRGG